MNIPRNNLRMSDDERGAFLLESYQPGECVRYRSGSQGDVPHVKWLWKYGRLARPDIVRSCIGLRPHWDIYIINNMAYRKHSMSKEILIRRDLYKSPSSLGYLHHQQHDLHKTQAVKIISN